MGDLVRTLYLGVIDLPYQPSEGKSKDLPSTGDVAEMLEKEYGVMRSFVDAHIGDIGDDLTESVTGAIEQLLIGGDAPENPLAEGFSNIEERFRCYLESQEVERQGIPGVPTKAAKAGVNHRLKKPNARENPRRPSFIDTGAYENSFKIWSD